MYNNSYFNTPYYNAYAQNYGSYQNNQFTRPVNNVQQTTPQVQTQNAPEMLFTDIRYANEEEAKAFLPAIGTRHGFIDRENHIFRVKACDMSGQTITKDFSYTEITESSAPVEDKNKDFVKYDDLKDFVKKDDLKGIVTVDDIKSLNARISDLQKQIKIHSILKDDGEQLSIYADKQ